MSTSLRPARRVLAGAALAAIATLGLAAPALANPDEATPEAPNAPAATSTVTLPLLGAPVTVDVTTDAGGGLLDVSVSPTGSGAADLAANPVRVNHVSFVNDDGTVKLKVAAVWGGERVSARAGSLADISGPGGWSGDVFGTGTTTEVGFTIGATAEGGPDITGITVNSPLEHTIGEVDYGEHRSRLSAKVGIEFTDQGQQRRLTIRATSADPESERSSASLKVSLSHPWGARIDDAAAVGPHSWAGTLCDGTEASVTYNVTDDGEITDVVATPDADVHERGKFVWVGFDRREGVALFAKESDDGLRVGALERIRCDRQHPTVDGEEVEQADDRRDDHDGDHGDGVERGAYRAAGDSASPGARGGDGGGDQPERGSGLRDGGVLAGDRQRKRSCVEDRDDARGGLPAAGHRAYTVRSARPTPGG